MSTGGHGGQRAALAGPVAVLRARDGGASPWITLADRARTRLLRATRPWSGRLAGDRELRVGVLAIGVVLGALLTTMLGPIWMLLLSPIVLGVPHLVADVRYCAVRTGLLTRSWLVLGGLVPVALAGLTGELAFGCMGAAAIFVLAEGPARTAVRTAGALACVAAAVWAYSDPFWPTLLMAHAHNFVAVGLWLAWRPRRTRTHWWGVGLFVLIAAALVALPSDRWAWLSASPIPGEAAYQAFALTGGRMRVAADHVGDAGAALHDSLAMRLVLLFCFAQSVHYGVWLRLIRDDDRARVTPRTFRASREALVSDLGWPLLVGAAILALGLAVWACFDLIHARAGYLRFARFHGSLELVAIAAIVVQGGVARMAHKHRGDGGREGTERGPGARAAAVRSRVASASTQDTTRGGAAP